MTKIICCHTAIHPYTMQQLLKWCPQVIFIKIDENDDYAYAKAISQYWNKGEDLVIVEQDIEIVEETIPSFEACDQQYCTFGYQVRGDVLTNCLGCVRFTARVQAECPDFPMKTWRVLDGFVWEMMATAGYAHHVHGTVVHYHDYSNGEITSALCMHQEDDQSDDDFRNSVVDMLRERGWENPEKLTLRVPA